MHTVKVSRAVAAAVVSKISCHQLTQSYFSGLEESFTNYYLQLQRDSRNIVAVSGAKLLSMPVGVGVSLPSVSFP